MERFDFSNLIFVDGGAVLVLADATVGRLADFGGKSVGVVAGTTTEQSLKSALKDKLIDAKVVPVKDEAEAMEALQSKKIDGYAADRVKLVALVALGKSDTKFRLVQDDFSYEPYALTMRRDADFRLAVNRGLAQVYRTGAIGEIYDRWLAPLGKPGPLLVAMYYLNALPE
jgi:ABC-type amino acid transport substrate-binding protein